VVNETIQISGDTFEVTSDGECETGHWRIADAGNQLISLVPQTIREDRDSTEQRIEEVMDENFESFKWGMFYTKMNRSYCVVLRGEEESKFGEILSTM